jgi:hypothetical protein
LVIISYLQNSNIQDACVEHKLNLNKDLMIR